MLNFVMLDRPDFVLVHASETVGAGRSEDGPSFLNPLFADIFQVMRIHMDISSESDPVHFGRAARSQIRPILRQYGFERLPRTLGELCGLFDYCDRLDAITGVGLFEQEMLARWQQLALALCEQCTGMPHRAAIELYRRGETSALLAWHQEQDVLTRLGTRYRYAPGR